MTRLCSCPESLAPALELDSRKTRLTEESCKTCGGRFVVNGIGPVSASMLSPVGLEVTSLTPELSWKRVTKGKRSRKPVARNVKGFAKLGHRSPRRVGDFLVSDSDKFDESATGCHFPGKGEHIPLKKRRHLLQSPSLPQSSSLNHEESLIGQPQIPSQDTDLRHSDSYTKQQVKEFGRPAGGKFRDNVDRVDGIAMSDVTDRKVFNPDDFPGIALLAAAACIDSMDDLTENIEEVEELLPEKSNPSTAPSSTGRCSPCIELKNPASSELVEEEFVHSSAGNMHSQSLCEIGEGGSVRLSVSSKVDRLHWDLNVVMDAWEQPFDDSVGASLKDVSDQNIEEGKLEKGDCETVKKSEDSQLDINNYISPKETLENESEMVSAPDRDVIKEMSVRQLDEHPAKSVDNLQADADVSNQAVSQISSSLSSPLLKLHEVSSVSGEVKVPATSETVSGMQEETKFRKSLASDSIKVAWENNASPEPFSGSSALVSEVADLSGKISDLPENSSSLAKMASSVIRKGQDVEKSGSNSYAVDQSQFFPKFEDLSASGTPADATVTESQKQVPASKKDGLSFPNDGAKTTSSFQDSSKKDDGSQSDDPATGSAKLSSSLEDCHNSDIFQNDQCNTVVSKDMTGLQAGYDSPYEDGEVRLSMSCPWEENEIYGENECVDYESDAREGVDSDGADYPGSEVVEAASEGSQDIDNRGLVVRESSVSDFSKIRFLKSSSRMHYRKDDIEKVDNGCTKVSTCGSGTSMGQSERNNDNVSRGYNSDHMDAVDMKGSRVEEDGSRAIRGKLQSRIEGPSSLDLSERERKDASFLSQSRSRIHSRPGRQISPDKFVGRQRSNFHVRGGNGGDEQWGYWDSRSRFPSSYRGQGYTRTRSIIADSADKFGGLNSQDHRQPINYSSKGINRTLARRSPFDRDDYYSIHRRASAARDMTTNRSRAGSGNYLQAMGRGGLREDHHEALADHRGPSSGRMPHYLSRRERSFSPSSGRAPLNSLARRKSQSRSRSRSPHVWHSRREGNRGIRRYSRSPDFRSEAMVERLRMPQHKHGFPVDYSAGIMSPPRGRSPPRNYRWADDPNYMDDDYLRNRRSPGRMFRWDQRFDSIGTGRLKSDECFRPGMRPGRFPPANGTGRGRKLDDSYDKRNRDERVEITHRARHSDTVNRFRHDSENNFVDDVRNTDQRDVSRSEKRPFKA